MKRIIAVFSACALLFCALFVGADASGWYHSGAKTLLLLVRDAPENAGLLTLDGIKEYVRSCELPEDWREGETELLAGIVSSAEEIYCAQQDGFRIVRVGIDEDREELSFELGALLEKNENVIEIFSTDHVYDKKENTFIGVYGDYLDGGYAVRLVAKKIYDYKQLEFRVFYNGETLEFNKLYADATAYRGLPFFTYDCDDSYVMTEPADGTPAEAQPDRCVRVTVRPLGCDTIAMDQLLTLFTVCFNTKKAGRMDLDAGCYLTKADGEAEALPVQSSFNKRVDKPYPAETAGEIADVRVNESSFCAIRNEYFARSSERLFRRAYELYKENTQPELLKNEGYKRALKFDDCGKNRFVSVIFRDGASDYGAGNEKMLARLGEHILETLYISGSTPCAVVLTDGKAKTLDAILRDENVEYIDDPFRINYEGRIWGEWTCPQTESMCRASKARDVLRVAARLTDPSEAADKDLARIITAPECVFCLYYDLDRDNQITSADARLVLRMAAKLDDARDYRVGFPCEWELYQF